MYVECHLKKKWSKWINGCPTWVVGLCLQDLQFSALSEGVLQTELQEAGLGPAHPFQQGQQSHCLLALVPPFEPAGQHAHLIAKHHGLREGVKADWQWWSGLGRAVWGVTHRVTSPKLSTDGIDKADEGRSDLISSLLMSLYVGWVSQVDEI